MFDQSGVVGNSIAIAGVSMANHMEVVDGPSVFIGFFMQHAEIGVDRH